LFSFPFYLYFIPILLALTIGLLAGIYPALVLSSLKSSEVIKGKLTSVKENILLRKSLVAFQFCIAAIVLIGSIIISKQVNYFFSKDLGYDKEYLLSAQVPRDWSAQGVAKMETIRNEITAMPQVSNASLSWEIPNGNNGNGAAYKAGQDSTQATYTELFTTDENYAATYKVPMAAGNFFTNKETYDSSKIVINETFAKTFGWKNAHDAINQQIKLQGYGNTIFTISGVVKDFHLWSMQGSIPVMTFVNVKLNPFYRYLSIRLKPGNIPDEINELQKKWSALMPGAPFEYRFMDEMLQKIYSTELQLQQAAYTSTVLALIIVLLGVVGLISLSIQKRTKEIGIRKVLGSSVAAIILLFIKEFLWVIVIGGFIAFPLGYLIMNKWLQNYAYRIHITASPFVISIVCLGLITVLIICIQTIKAAMANPVKSLRTE
jgi:putative ABC transport system permease protein